MCKALSCQKNNEKEFLGESRLKQVYFTKIGEITHKDIMLVLTNKKEFDFKDFKIHARNFESVSDYIQELTNWKSCCSLLLPHEL